MSIRRKDTTEVQPHAKPAASSETGARKLTAIQCQELKKTFARIAKKKQREPLWAIEDPLTRTWKCNGGDRYLRGDFRARAAEAGKALGCPKDRGPVDFWLDQLYFSLEKTNSNPIVLVSASMPGAVSGNPDELKPTKKGKEVRVIRRVSKESSAFCAELEEQAHQHVELDVAQRTVQARLKAEEKPQLMDREKKILAVIQRGTGGRQYARELDNAKIAPPRSGVWKDGPRKYLAAYDLGKPWRHRIEDEKSKTRRKGKTAKLAGTLAGE